MNAQRPPSPSAEEILGREEAEGRRDAGRRDAAGAECLGGVLDLRHAELGELGERRRPAEKVHRHDRLRPRRDPARDVLNVEVERGRVDVREHGRRAAAGDRLGGRVERERRADDLVARPDSHAVEHEHERVGAVRDADRLRHAQVGRGLLLERLDVRSENEHAGVDDLGESLQDVIAQRSELRAHIYQRHRHGAQSLAGQLTDCSAARRRRLFRRRTSR